MILRRKKNWKSLELEQYDSGYILTLDGVALKTPQKKICTIDNLFIAKEMHKEWAGLHHEINYQKMPFTRTSFITLDRSENENVELKKKIVGYGMSDLFCYWAERGSDLEDIQAKRWGPLIEWVQIELRSTLRITHSLMPIKQSIGVERGWIKLLEPVQTFALTALGELVALSGSLIIGLGLQKEKISPENAWQLIRIDEEWQRDKWGRLDEHKKEDRINKSAFMHSCRVLKLVKSQ